MSSVTPQRTTTVAPSGMRSLAQIMSIAVLLSLALPWDAGQGGMLGDPCTAKPRWKKRGRHGSPREFVSGPSTPR